MINQHSHYVTSYSVTWLDDKGRRHSEKVGLRVLSNNIPNISCRWTCFVYHFLFWPKHFSNFFSSLQSNSTIVRDFMSFSMHLWKTSSFISSPWKAILAGYYCYKWPHISRLFWQCCFQFTGKNGMGTANAICDPSSQYIH